MRITDVRLGGAVVVEVCGGAAAAIAAAGVAPGVDGAASPGTVAGNGVSIARCISFLSRLLRVDDGVIAGAAAPLRLAVFVSGGGVAASGFFACTARVNLPSNSSFELQKEIG